MDQDKPKNISIVTERNKNAVTIPVTGAWGGTSADQSSIVAHFFIEYKSMPNIIDVEVDDAGKADPNKGKQTTRGDVTRETQATLMMTPESAVSIGKWLMEKGSQAIAIRNQGRNPNK